MTEGDGQEAAPAAPTEARPSFTIRFARTGREFPCSPNVPILMAAKAAGIPMPSSCRKGECGTCKSLKLSGEVKMSGNGGVRDREIARGLILPCVSRPLSDVVLDR